MKNRRPKYHPSSGSQGTQNNGPLFTQNSPLSGAYPNGDKECPITKTRISHSACIVQSCRYPAKCKGCKFESKEAL